METRDQIEALRATLRERGPQVTAARVGVLQVLREGHQHKTADEIRSDVLARYPTIDPATVYRTLETLEEHALAVRVTLGDKLTRWAHVSDLHHHLVCRNCKTVVEIEDAPFQRFAQELAASYGIEVDMQHLVLHGLCRQCAAALES